MVALTADEALDIKALADKLGLTFPVLSDKGLTIAESFGVRQAGEDIPLPAIFVVDARGVVIWEKVGENPTDRPTMNDILGALKQP